MTEPKINAAREIRTRKIERLLPVARDHYFERLRESESLDRKLALALAVLLGLLTGLSRTGLPDDDIGRLALILSLASSIAAIVLVIMALFPRAFQQVAVGKFWETYGAEADADRFSLQLLSTFSSYEKKNRVVNRQKSGKLKRAVWIGGFAFGMFLCLSFSQALSGRGDAADLAGGEQVTNPPTSPGESQWMQILPSLFWIAFWAVLLYSFRKQIALVLERVAARAGAISELSFAGLNVKLAGVLDAASPQTAIPGAQQPLSPIAKRLFNTLGYYQEELVEKAHWDDRRWYLSLAFFLQRRSSLELLGLQELLSSGLAEVRPGGAVVLSDQGVERLRSIPVTAADDRIKL